jgi:serine/threonine protein kinase
MIPAYLEVPSNAYRCNGKLNQGGLAEIYIAMIADPKLLQRSQNMTICVAKVLKGDKTGVKAFLQEVSVMHYLGSCQNIAKMFGFDRIQKVILMKHYPLGSLAGFIQQGALGVPYNMQAVFNIIHGISSGLWFMHTRKIAHSDMKPGNVLLEPLFQGSNLVRAVLTDFGISRILEPQFLAVRAFEVANQRGLSIRYAAPEVMLECYKQIPPISEPRIVASGDVYSFGVVICEMLTRAVPWSRNT